MSSSSESQLIKAVVDRVKSGGIFDDFRRQCQSDADTKPSFQNLLQRVEGYVSKFLTQQKWSQNTNKNQLRERLRKQINESGMLKYGVEHLVEQVVNYKINSLFWPQIENVVKEFLGIQETPAIPTTPLTPSNKSLSKSNLKSSVKSEETIEMKAIIIKDEPIEAKLVPFEDSSEAMDIETDSNSSLGNKETNVKIESEDNSDNGCMDWPTPPKPEELTPERQPIEPIESSQSIDEPNSAHKSDDNIFMEGIKVNETFLINNSLLKEFKSENICETSSVNMRTTDNLDINEHKKAEESDLSDVSSVHTSDLSDFDDEISLDDSNDESNDNKKNKISLKVVKKMTEVLSNEQTSDRPMVDRNQKISNVSTEDQTNELCVKSESKRVRKINPKYSSEEFSSIFTEKDRTIASTSRDDLDDYTPNKNPKTESDINLRSTSRKRRLSNCSESDAKESHELSSDRSSKVTRKQEEMPLDSRSSSRGSVESSLSETTQDSTHSQNRPKRNVNKNRNESQAQRYEASDLYKPRRLGSSRRRVQTTPESSTQSNEDFFIHDLSK